MKKSRFTQPDGTETIHTSPRQADTYLYLTGAGDDVVGGRIGEGTSLFIQNPEGLNEVSVEAQFTGVIFLKDGYVFWENAAVGDRVSLDMYLPAGIPLESDTGTGNAAEVDGEITYITDSQSLDETWVGTHLLFPIDVVLNRFVNKLHLLGSNTHGLVLESTDAIAVPKEIKLKVRVVSPTGNTNIRISVMIEMYREKTI